MLTSDGESIDLSLYNALVCPHLKNTFRKYERMGGNNIKQKEQQNKTSGIEVSHK